MVGAGEVARRREGGWALDSVNTLMSRGRQRQPGRPCTRSRTPLRSNQTRQTEPAVDSDTCSLRVAGRASLLPGCTRGHGRSLTVLVGWPTGESRRVLSSVDSTRGEHLISSKKRLGAVEQPAGGTVGSTRRRDCVTLFYDSSR